MTLEEAIEEVKPEGTVVLYRGGWPLDVYAYRGSDPKAVEVVPKADADLAVAEALRKAGDDLDQSRDYWIDTAYSARLRAEAAEAEVTRLLKLIRRVVDDPHWRTVDNTLWPDLCDALTRKGEPT